MTKKQSLIGLVISIILFIVGVGITFAIYTFSRNGTVNSKQIVGDIYMHYTESNSLTLENAMPRNSYIPNSYFQFTIDGKNTTTNKDIYYDILLSHGDVPNGKTEENRIDDKFLKFRLVEVINNEETEIFNNKSYSNLTNKRIHVETIPKNTTNEIIHRYRLYMWIGNEVTIGTEADYTMSDWANLFASVKVNVSGDFNEKYATTPPQCFITEDNGNNTLKVKGLIKNEYDINKNMTESELQSCINYVKEKNSYITNDTAAETFCNDTTTMNGIGYSFVMGNYDSDLLFLLQENIVIQTSTMPSICEELTNLIIPWKINGKTVTVIGNNAFSNNQLTSIVIPNSITSIEYNAFSNNQLTSVEIPNSVTTIGNGAFAGNKLTSVEIPNSVTTMERGVFDSNQLTSIVIPNSITTIEYSVFSNNQLTSVKIPNSVTTISSGAFAINQLTSVEIPNSVTNIGSSAFENNQLTSITIPNSVTTIGEGAFYGNQLSSVVIGNGITSIGHNAFSKSNHTYITDGITYYDNPNLSSITIDKSCNDIKNVIGVSGSNNYYPWLSYSSPYTGLGGVTIYGSNNQVCDTF